MSISTNMFWSGLLSGAFVALIVNVICLVYLLRSEKHLPDYQQGAVNMLAKVALYECVPLIALSVYFVFRLVVTPSTEEQQIGLVSYAALNYLSALVGLALPAICSAALTHYSATKAATEERMAEEVSEIRDRAERIEGKLEE